MKASDLVVGQNYAYLYRSGNRWSRVAQQVIVKAPPTGGQVEVHFLHPDPEVPDWDQRVFTREIVGRWEDDIRSDQPRRRPAGETWALREYRAWHKTLEAREIADRLTAAGAPCSRPALHGRGGLIREGDIPASVDPTRSVATVHFEILLRLIVASEPPRPVTLPAPDQMDWP